MSDSILSPADASSDWLVFECNSCGRPLKVRPHQSGARMRCPACSADIVAPAVAGAHTPSAGDADAGDEVPLISEANRDLDQPLPVGEAGRELAVDRLGSAAFRKTDDPELAIPDGGLRVRKRKRRSNQSQQQVGLPEWEAAAAGSPDTATASAGPWFEVTSATVGVDQREDGSVVERRKRFLKKRLPKFLERVVLFFLSLGIWSLIGLGVLVLLGAVAAGWYVARSRMAPMAPVVPVDQFPKRLYASRDEGQAAADVVTAFLQADGVDAKLEFVRFPEKVEPLMRRWYASRPAGPVQSTRDDIALSLT
jgi:hypothetical protein